MKLKKNSSEQKLRGAYYTPLQLAKAMVGLFAQEEINSILEPSCGDGVFMDSLKQLGMIDNVGSITAVEIEPNESSIVRNKYMNHKNVEVLTEDFFEFYNRTLSKQQYDLILGNPPYIRYQYLSDAQREVLSNILMSHGMKANKLINAWVAFLVACVQLLSENGRIAFVVPAEILQVAYAEDLRLFLSNNLAKITLVTFEQLVFSDIEQEVVVLIGEKSDEEKGIRIIEMRDLNDFSRAETQRNGFIKMLHVREKWTKYFINSDDMDLIQQIRSDSRFAKFSDFGVINVGITTGNNSYFSITENTCKKYELEDVTLPLIGRSSHAHGIYYTKQDWEKNKSSGKRARLIQFPDIDLENYPEKHREYIARGEANGENDGYKCSIRTRWYIVPSVWIPDAFFLRRNNLYPKFVLNQFKAVSTDTMHRMKFYDGIEPETLLLAYYNSISFAFTEICGRSYGGGVLEILPGEMGNIMIPNIPVIDLDIRTELLQRIDLIVRTNSNIEMALEIVDQEILVKMLGIDYEWCKKCRSIWKILQKRRLERGSDKVDN